jgi:hypothetical protein
MKALIKTIIFIALILTQNVYSREMKADFLTTDFKGTNFDGNNLICYGNYGVILVSNDSGDNWKRYNFENDINFIGSFIHQNETYLYSDNNIYKINSSFFTLQNIGINVSNIKYVASFESSLIVANDKNLYIYKDNNLIEFDNIKNFIGMNIYKDKLYLIDSLYCNIYNINNLKKETTFKFNSNGTIKKAIFKSDKFYVQNQSGIYSGNLNDTLLKFITNYPIFPFNSVSDKILHPFNVRSSNKLPHSPLVNPIDPPYSYTFYVYENKNSSSNVYGTINKQRLVMNNDNYVSYEVYGQIHIIVGENNIIYLSKDEGKNWELKNYFNTSSINVASNRLGDFVITSGNMIFRTLDNINTFITQESKSEFIPYSSFSVGINDEKEVLTNHTTNQVGIKSTILFHKDFKTADTAINYEAAYSLNYLYNCPSVGNYFFAIENRNFKEHFVTEFFRFNKSAQSEELTPRIDSSEAFTAFEHKGNLYVEVNDKKEPYVVNEQILFRKNRVILYRTTDYGDSWQLYDTLPGYLIYNNGKLYGRYGQEIIYSYDLDSKSLNLHKINEWKNSSSIFSFNKLDEFYRVQGKNLHIYNQINPSQIDSIPFNSIIKSYTDSLTTFYTVNYLNRIIYNNDSLLYLAYSVFKEYIGQRPIFKNYLVKLTPKSTTSIESPQVEESAYLYTYPPRPNPATQSVSAEVYWNSAYTLSESNVSVYDIYGSKYNSNITFTSKEPFRAIINADCSNLATGIYFIRISVNGEYKTIPFTVVK